MKYIKRIVFVLSFILIYFIVKEFLSLYAYLSSINELFAIIVMVIIGIAFIYFGIIPIIQIFALPVNYGPIKEEEKIPGMIKRRIKKFRGNNFLKETNFDFTSLQDTRESYDRIIKTLEPECKRIRKVYVNQVFYSTSISQNGFLDAILIFSSSVNIVKDIFLLYHGRVSNRDLFNIARKVYYSILIGGSEGVEYATEELFSKFATETMKGIPFLDKILSSLADGFINAVLLTRISLITENYCKLLYIEKDRDLYPKPSFIFATAKDLTSEIFIKVKKNMFALAKEKSEAIFRKAVNPVAVVLESLDGIKDTKPYSIVSSITQKGKGWLKSFLK